MSHAANLRKYRPQNQNQLPPKKRKLSPTATASENLTNGISHVPKTFSAIPTQDAKASKSSKAANGGNSVVTYPQDEDSVDDESSESSSSDDDEGEDDDDDDEEEEEDSSSNEVNEEDESRDKQKASGSSEESSSDSESESDASEEDEHATNHTQPNPAKSQPDEEPSFGDLIALRAPEETIHVESLLNDSSTKAIATSSTNPTMEVPSANSLGTVLTQALKTNDIDLLESCLHVSNLESIRATIERIHPSHATTLLQRLAERVHKRPGRAGSLMVWIQWTVVAHGGYLASQPAAMKELRTLYQVVKQRASGLQPLLALKGKLDMLEAQMQLRRNMQARSRANHSEDEEDILYVEGQENSDSEDEKKAPGMTSHNAQTGNSSMNQRMQSLGDEASDVEIISKLPNGISTRNDDRLAEDEEEEGESDSSDEQEALVDDEAEENEDSSSEMSDDIDYDDVDGVGGATSEEDSDYDEDEDEEELPPAKRPKALPASIPSRRR